MVSSVIERASELRRIVDELAQLRDEIGVLSVTVGVDPGTVSGRVPAPAIVVKNELARLRHDGTHLLKSRLDAASETIEDLLKRTTPGRGHAFYVALESGAARELALERALPTSASLGPAAHVVPLLAALDEGKKTGLVRASRDAVVVSELELGHMREVQQIDLEPWIGDWWPEMKGPARANPQSGQQIVSQRDRYARRLAAAYRHTLGDAASAIAALAAERAWAQAVLAGDPRRVSVLEAALRSGVVATTTIEANLEGARTDTARARFEEAIDALVERQRARLVEDVVAAQDAACGLARVLGALAEGRVDELVIDADRAILGALGSGERLVAAELGQETTDLTDLIVARALQTGAAVKPVSGRAAEALAPFDGIAALLRW